MTHRVTGVLMWTLVVTMLVLAAAGCTRRANPSNAPTTGTPAVTPAPIAVSHARGDPALSAAVRFEHRRCAWTWRKPLAAYLAAQQTVATPAYGRQLAAQTDPVAWRNEVVAGRQVVTCTITEAHRLAGAPSTPMSVYTRISVTEQISSTMGSFSGGERIVSWLVHRVGGQWLVAGTFDGG